MLLITDYYVFGHFSACRSSGKAPIAKRDYNSAVTLKGWLTKQVNIDLDRKHSDSINAGADNSCS